MIILNKLEKKMGLIYIYIENPRNMLIYVRYSTREQTHPMC